MIVRVLTGSGAVATANVEARSGEDVVVVKNSLGEMSIESHFFPIRVCAEFPRFFKRWYDDDR